MELEHNLALVSTILEEKGKPWLTHAYRTLAFTEGSSEISTLPCDLREQILDAYDIFFALCQERVQSRKDFDEALIELKALLPEIIEKIQKHI